MACHHRCRCKTARIDEPPWRLASRCRVNKSTTERLHSSKIKMQGATRRSHRISLALLLIQPLRVVKQGAQSKLSMACTAANNRNGVVSVLLAMLAFSLGAAALVLLVLLMFLAALAIPLAFLALLAPAAAAPTFCAAAAAATIRTAAASAAAAAAAVGCSSCSSPGAGRQALGCQHTTQEGCVRLDACVAFSCSLCKPRRLGRALAHCSFLLLRVLRSWQVGSRHMRMRADAATALDCLAVGQPLQQVLVCACVLL